MRVDVHKLKKLLKRPEGKKLDFKRKLLLKHNNDKKEFVKDICAIANSKGGRGYLVYGVEDKTKEIVGVEKHKYDEEKMQQIVCNRCDPPVPIRVDFIKYQRKNVAVVTIFKTNQSPHQVRRKGNFYIRRGSTTDVARREEIANMFQENGLLSYELVMNKNARITELDKNLIKKYLGINMENKIMLEALGIIDKDLSRGNYHPTLGGLLLFGKNPQIFLPHAGIRVEYNGEVFQVRGNILEMFEKSKILIESFDIHESVKKDLIVGAIINAMIHRDYWDLKREIVVLIDENKVEVSNPGAIWRHRKIRRSFKEVNPPKRNQWLYQRLLLMDNKKQFLNHSIKTRKIEDEFKNIRIVNKPYKNLFKVIMFYQKEKHLVRK